MKAAGEPSLADIALTNGLALAEPEGYLRIFLDEGRPMQGLLDQWLVDAESGHLRDYAMRLLAHFDAEMQGITAAQKKASPTGVPLTHSEQILVEALSPRELEVLQLIALGRTNQEIARQLIVSPGTVKARSASGSPSTMAMSADVSTTTAQPGTPLAS